MNLTALKTWVSGETLTATDLNAEFQNIYTHTITNSDIDSTGTYVLGELVVGSGITAADGGQFHVHTASAGSVQAHADANEAVLENSAASGLSILSGSSSDGNIFFGDAADNDIGKIAYSHSANSLAFTTNGATALTLSSAQAATFAGDVSVGGALTLTGGLTLNGAVVVGDSASDTLTVNATVTSDLLFTDATYDIGKSGATRPRDGHFSRNMAVGGTLGVTGATTLSSTLGVTGLITASGGLSGALTGNVTGNVTGNLTGDVTGNISGNVTGGTISGTTGTFTGALSAQTLTANNGTLYLDDNGSHNGLINVPASLFLNIDSDNGATNEKFQIAKDRSGTSGGTVLFELGEDGDLAVDTDTLFVDASADRVGVNTSSADASLHIIGSAGDPSAAHSSGNAQLILENNGQTYLEFATGTTHYSGITFSDDVATRGAVVYDHGTALGGGADSLHFQTAGSIKAVITSAGNVGISTISPLIPLQLNTYGGLDGNSNQMILRNNLYYDTVDARSESIKAGYAEEIYLNNSEGSITFRTSSSAATGANEALSTTERLRILSSGGITFNGDTSSNNALDDYEEGTWTPSMNGGTVSVYSARYTKIGNTVTVSCYIYNIAPTNNASTFYVGGLPYNTSSASNFYHAGQIGYSGSATTEDLGLIGARNADHMYFHYLNSTNSGSSVTNAQVISSSITTLILSLTYTTD